MSGRSARLQWLRREDLALRQPAFRRPRDDHAVRGKNGIELQPVGPFAGDEHIAVAIEPALEVRRRVLRHGGHGPAARLEFLRDRARIAIDDFPGITSLVAQVFERVRQRGRRCGKSRCCRGEREQEEASFRGHDVAADGA
jgi:hypothetical protein